MVSGWLHPPQDDDRLGLGRAAFSHRADLLRGLELDRQAIDVDLQRSGQLLANGNAELLELGSLEDYRRIDVHDFIADLCGQVPRVPQEYQAVAALPARIGIREMHADVAQCSGAQQGIRDRMRENIGVGVALQSEVTGNRDAAENQGSAGRDAMYIPALTHSNLTHRPGQVRRPVLLSPRSGSGGGGPITTASVFLILC